MRRTVVLALGICLLAVMHAAPTRAAHNSCAVDRVIDGDTFVCTDGTHVRLLQINAEELSDCGGGWAKAALENIFLKPGTNVGLDHDAVLYDKYSRELAAPIVRGTDGNDYNISIVMAYVGLAKSAYYGDNAKYLPWAQASENWARVAQWNMRAPGGPYNGATNCGGSAPPPPPPPPPAGNCDPAYPTVCIPSPPPDLNCGDIPYRNFPVNPPDPHHFDGDHDGIGCEA